MHENRETSEAPAAEPGSRSAGEGKSRTARAYVSEESHGGIVPINHSNKDGNSLAENGEGTTLMAQSTMLAQVDHAGPLLLLRGTGESRQSRRILGSDPGAVLP